MAVTITMELMTMIDIHCHLLYSVDDGSKSIEESITILRSLKDLGYTDIILTPHYVKDSKQDRNVKNNSVLFNKLKDKVLEENININLYLGNEIYIDDDIMDLLNDKEITSLNDSDYLLIELPLTGD